jgi:hypothetical protein
MDSESTASGQRADERFVSFMPASTGRAERGFDMAFRLLERVSGKAIRIDDEAEDARVAGYSCI